jgi:phosphoglycolate phosphatase
VLEGSSGIVVIVIVLVVAVAMHVGARFRIEGRGDVRHGRTEVINHVLDDGVSANAQAVAEKLGRQVPVAEVPGDAQQFGGCGRGDLGQRLRGGVDGDDAAILENQSVAVLQRHGLSEIEQEFEAAGGGHGHAAAVALVVVQHDAVGLRLRPFPGSVDAGRADHRFGHLANRVKPRYHREFPSANGQAMLGILFDKDGTLLDFEATWLPVLRAFARDLTRGDEDAAEAMLAMGGFDPATGRFRAGSAIAAGTSVDVARLWYPTLDGDALAVIVAHADESFRLGAIEHSVALPGVAATLAELAELGHVMGVATNDGTATAAESLEAIGLADFFSSVFGYDAVAHPKPAPDMVLAFAAEAGVIPADIVVVGDNAHDLLMARSAGAGAAIGVLSGNGAANDLAPFADAILESICDLPAWLADNR